MERVKGPRASMKHRLLRLAVLAGVGYLVFRVLSAQPSEVQVVYHYGTAGQGLREACMRYLRVDEQVRRVRFHYSGAAARTQQHQVRLPDGDYTVELDLTYAGGAAPTASRPASTGPQKTVRLKRPLLVRGSGSVNIYVGAAP